MQFFDTHAHIGLIYDDPIKQVRVVQEAKQAQYELEKAKIENEKKIAEAEANAKVMQVQDSSTTENALKLKAHGLASGGYSARVPEVPAGSGLVRLPPAPGR